MEHLIIKMFTYLNVLGVYDEVHKLLRLTDPVIHYCNVQSDTDGKQNVYGRTDVSLIYSSLFENFELTIPITQHISIVHFLHKHPKIDGSERNT